MRCKCWGYGCDYGTSRILGQKGDRLEGVKLNEINEMVLVSFSKVWREETNL